MFSVLGAGVAGLCAATALAERGAQVEVIDPAPKPQGASRYAGAMLAPFCEGEAAPDTVVERGRHAVEWWAARVPGVVRRGTLVVAPPRDRTELARFGRATTGHVPADPGALEPDLAGRFAEGLHYAEEAHLDPRQAMTALATRLRAMGVELRFGGDATPRGEIIDCRGLAAREMLDDLRAVRGEMLLVRTREVTLTRAVRLLHPRFPCYVIPRGEEQFLIGATMIESDDAGPISARAAMELVSAAYTLHPAFAEARVIEAGVGLRPAFPDNVPRIVHRGGRIHLNGFYRHGFLLAPALAEELAATLYQEKPRES